MEIQYHPVTLPGSKAYGSVEIRPFGSTDVEAYERVKRNSSEPALRNLIGNTLKGVDVNDLYEPDFLFAMMWHRVNSFPVYPMKLPWTCPTCERENNDILDLTKLISDEMPEDYDPEGVPIEFPCGIPLVTRLPKAGDEAKSRSLLSILGKEINQANLLKAETVQLFEHDKNFNGQEKWDIVNRAFAVEDVFTIDAFKRTFSYGPKTVLRCRCPSCGGQQNVGFRFSLLEFLPSDFDRGTIRTRILPHTASRDSARRAKEALLQKTPLVSAPSPKDLAGFGEGEETPRREHRQGSAEVSRPGKEHEHDTDRIPQVVNKTSSLSVESQKFPLPQNPNSKDVDLSRKWGGPPGMPVTPQLNAAMGAKLLEEATHEAAVETGKDGKKATAAEVLDFNK